MTKREKMLAIAYELAVSWVRIDDFVDCLLENASYRNLYSFGEMLRIAERAEELRDFQDD
jgi:hypothetical protein